MVVCISVGVCACYGLAMSTGAEVLVFPARTFQSVLRLKMSSIHKHQPQF
jgi:hypothetical protein